MAHTCPGAGRAAPRHARARQLLARAPRRVLSCLKVTAEVGCRSSGSQCPKPTSSLARRASSTGTETHRHCSPHRQIWAPRGCTHTYKLSRRRSTSVFRACRGRNRSCAAAGQRGVLAKEASEEFEAVLSSRGDYVTIPFSKYLSHAAKTHLPCLRPMPLCAPKLCPTDQPRKLRSRCGCSQGGRSTSDFAKILCCHHHLW